MAGKKKIGTWVATLQHAPKDGTGPDDEPGWYAVDFPAVAPALDAIAATIGVRPLGDFYFDDSVFDDDSAREVLEERHGPGSGPEDMDEDTYEMLPDLVRVWRSWKGPFFPPDEGLRTVRGLIAHARANPAEVDGLGLPLDADGVAHVLGELEEVLEYGRRAGRDFRLGPPGPA